MKDEKKATRKTSKTKTNSVKFEETYEGQTILNSISAAFYKVRKENQYIGETRIMQNLSKKNNQPKQTNNTAQELERYNAVTSNDKVVNIQENIITQLYKKEGYMRTNRPKN